MVAAVKLLRRLPVGLWLIVLASVVVRSIAAFFRSTPVLFPDEYIYAALGRAIAESGLPSVRGASASFPALLQPIVTAPLWWLPSVEASYRAIQLLNVTAMSLAAVPAYYLARELQVRQRYSLLCAALAVLTPGMLYSTWMLSEPYAYPLFLASVWMAVRALRSPSYGAQGFLFAFALATTFARVQFVVIIPAYLFTVVMCAALQRNMYLLRRHLVMFGLLLFGVFAAVAAGPHRILGFYEGITKLDRSPLYLAEWMARDAVALAYISGWIIVPGALLFFARSLGLTEERKTVNCAFSVLTISLMLGILIEAAMYSADSRIQERYFFYLVPLLFIAFIRYVESGWPWSRVHALLLLGLSVGTLALPLSDLMIDHMKDASPFLLGADWITQRSGVAITALLPAIFCLAAVSLIVAMRLKPGRAIYVAIVPAFAVIAMTSISSTLFDVLNTRGQRGIGEPVSYVDDRTDDPATLLVLPGSRRLMSVWQLFWNRSIKEVVVMPGAAAIDPFRSLSIGVSENGTMYQRISKKPVEGPILYDPASTTLVFRNGSPEKLPYHLRLWKGGRPQISMLTNGFFESGWMGVSGGVYLWPKSENKPLNGTLRVDLRLDRSEYKDQRPVTIRIDANGSSRTIKIRPGARVRVNVPVCSDRKWRASFSSIGGVLRGATAMQDGNLLAAQAKPPLFTDDGTGCDVKRTIEVSDYTE